MSPFDAACHTFSTLGNGGFSTKTASIAAYNSLAVESILVIFMLLAGINFTLHYRFWVERQVRNFFQDAELRFYLWIVAFATIGILLGLVFHNQYGVGEALRVSLFQVTPL
jgi:trk system potassium uptake protein TrkH